MEVAEKGEHEWARLWGPVFVGEAEDGAAATEAQSFRFAVACAEVGFLRGRRRGVGVEGLSGGVRTSEGRGRVACAETVLCPPHVHDP